jgi:hypothetical protein
MLDELYHWVPPQVRLAGLERAASGETAEEETASATGVWGERGVDLGGNLGGGRLSVVGAAEGVDPSLAALGEEALLYEPDGGEPVLEDQCSPDRSAASGTQEEGGPAPLWPDQAGK